MRMFTTEPAARPYSGRNWLVIKRNSATTSGLLISCTSPVTEELFESAPSIMKLLERVRIPLTEKLTPPEVKFELPLESWLTPGACSTIFRILRLGESGSSAIRLASILKPTSALVVLISGASVETVMTSAAEAT